MHNHNQRTGWFTGAATNDSPLRNELPSLKSAITEDAQANELRTTAHLLRDGAEQRTPKHKKHSSLPIEGSRLAMGAMSAKPRGTAVGEMEDIEERPTPVDEPAREDVELRLADSDYQARTAYQSDGIPSKPESSTISQKAQLEPTQKSQPPPTTPSPPQESAEDDSSVPSSRPSEVSAETAEPPFSEKRLGQKDVDRAARLPSVSPARSAHFAPVAVEFPNSLHHPPPRSLSPAKSAMKSSPSGRNHSPNSTLLNGPSRLSFSEISDNMSDDGMRPAKKKSVRVSFDEPAVLGASESFRPESPTSASKGLATSRWSTTAPEDDLEDVMKPRPVLPSFGSVRGRKTQPDEIEKLQKVTETVSSSMTNSVSTIGDAPLEASSDHAIGNIIANDMSNKANRKTGRDKETDKVARGPLDPVPPEVTSVEGSGYWSDSDSSMQDAQTAPQPAPSQKIVHEELGPDAKITHEKNDAVVPLIAVQPATPAAEEEEPIDEMFVPGSFPAEDERPTNQSSIEGADSGTSQVPTTVVTPSQAVPLSVIQDEIDQRPESERLSTVEEESSDNSSIYSDAYEDLTDDEDEPYGFGSIDALVGTSTQPKRIKTPPPRIAEEPEKAQMASHAITTDVGKTRGNSQDWDQTKAYWSGVNERRRQNDDQDDTPVKSAVPDRYPLITTQQTKQKKPAAAQTGSHKSGNAVSQPVRAPQQAAQPASPPRKSAMKQSLRTPQVDPLPQPHMRHSMREQQPVTLRSSMRGGPGLGASRYAEQIPEGRETRAALQKRQQPPVQQSTRITPQPTNVPGLTASMHNPANISRIGAPLKMAPVAEDDSDLSDSSFRKERRKRKAALGSGGERYTMRRSMRGAPVSQAPAPTMRPTSPPAPVSSSRFSIRSLSPTGRMTQRSMRPGTSDSKYGPNKSFLGFGKEKQRATPPKAAPKPKSRFTSRFADSSDEEESRPTFQSRFADSDDEDDVTPVPIPMPTTMPSGLTPVRGIPRRAGEEDGDSTDLEDEESDREVPSTPKNKAPAKKTEVSGPKVGPKVHNGTLEDSKHAPNAHEAIKNVVIGTPEKGKRRFFGLGKRRVSAGPGSLPPLQRPSTPPSLGQDAEASTSVAPSSPKAARPRSPKLQRRQKPARVMSDSWPLPPTMPAAFEDRPQSHDGFMTGSPARNNVNGIGGASGRPTLQKRILSNDTVTTNGTMETTITAGTTGPTLDDEGRVVKNRMTKKKKVPLWKKMFGRHE